MSFTLSQLFPSIENGLNQIGFLFGAGTSKEAGYPLVGDLTRQVVGSLSSDSKSALKEILERKGINYDDGTATPNIEELSDIVIEASVDTPKSSFSNLEAEIRDKISEIILSVSDPDIAHHVNFIEALKRRAHGQYAKITILTTNYDVLFEIAAAEVGVRIETGFDGALKRNFLPATFDLSRGILAGDRFTRRNELQINLFKLHGSISWTKENGRVFESGASTVHPSVERTLILPRRTKVIETLSEPYDQLFAKASRTLGSECKFIASCGFSFGDKHINDQLIIPNINEGKIKLTALCGVEPGCLTELTSSPAFQIGLPDRTVMQGKDVKEGTDLWKFSELSKLISEG